MDSWTASENYPHSKNHQEKVAKLSRKIAKYQSVLYRYESKLNANRNQRLVQGLLLFAAGVAFMSKALPLSFGWVFLALTLSFSIWIVRTRRLHKFVEVLRIRQMYLKRMRGKLTGEFSSHEWVNFEENPYEDLHLFGPKSLFSLINETFSIEASQALASQLVNGLDDRKDIENFQNRVEPLGLNPFLCERFLHLGHQNTDEPISSKDLESSLAEPLLGPGFVLALIAHAILFPTYLTAFFMIGYGQIKAPLSLPVVLYALFSLATLKVVKGSFRQSEIMERYLSRFQPILHYLESKSIFFKDHYSSRGPSFNQSISVLKLCVSFLSIQSHGLAYIIVNGLMPWTLVFSAIAERWRKKNKGKFSELLIEMRKIEILSCAAILSHYHTGTNPKFSEARDLQAKDVYHPMIPRDQVVANAVHLNSEEPVVLLTGSNMSGKSTFMRSVAINQILALSGLTVFASQFNTRMAKVESCLQIKDNLEQGYSYFYAEVRKVKNILEQASAGAPILFFIDEIFKGTNNRERFLGSKAVIKALSQSKSAMGIISTHDLELAHLAEDSKNLNNYHFRDDIDSDHLVFDYRIQPGPCPTTNALKIMAAEGLPVDSVINSR